MTTKNDRTQSIAPVFVNEHDAAEFWDAHSPLDYPEDFEAVDVAVSRSARAGRVTVHLDPVTIDRLGALAAERGVEPSMLVRSWILEHVRSISSEPAAAPSG